MISDINCVISAYGEDGIARSQSLASIMTAFCRKVVVVINEPTRSLESCQRVGLYYEVRRPNSGMNIGAWLAGLPHCDAGLPVICLQDECELVSIDGPQYYCDLLSQPGVGMVGESINRKWAQDWGSMKDSPLNYVIRLPNDEGVTRVDFYLQCMKKWGIKAGHSAAHLRTLACGFPWGVAQRLPRLALSDNKEECIAAEIGLSQFVLNNLGLKVMQSADTPFLFFSHSEWQLSGLSKKYTTS